MIQAVNLEAVEERVDCVLCGPGPTRFYDALGGRQFVQCRRCGLVFQNPRIIHNYLMLKGAIRYDTNYFYRQAGRLENISSKVQEARLKVYRKELATLEKYSTGGRIFDVGCGTGRFLAFFPDRWEKHGCDISADGVKIAREQYGLRNVQLGEFETLDLSEDYYDAVYFRASLHHVYNPMTSLEKAARILKKNGCLVVFTNCRTGLSGRLLRCRTRTVNVNVTYFFDPRVLARMLDRIGFRIQESFAPYWGTGYESYSDLPVLLLTALAIRVIRPALGRRGHKAFDGLVGPAWHKNSVVYFCARKKNS
ncbi:MAG: class I SAM-dependent methyltransferase [Thermodesulfobacteriota bacterium]